MASALFSNLKYSDSLTLVGISICSAAVCEAISWLLVYRTASYKSLKSTINKASKKLETMKTTGSNNPASNILKKSKTKKKDRVETSLKESSRDLFLSKFKSGAVVSVVLCMVFGLLNSLFEGKAVAKIPFVPIRLAQKMSHWGLPGDDMSDCSMAFLYLLCSISIWTNLQKFLGFSPPCGAANAGIFPMLNVLKGTHRYTPRRDSRSRHFVTLRASTRALFAHCRPFLRLGTLKRDSRHRRFVKLYAFRTLMPDSKSN